MFTVKHYIKKRKTKRVRFQTSMKYKLCVIFLANYPTCNVSGFPVCLLRKLVKGKFRGDIFMFQSIFVPAKLENNVWDIYFKFFVHVFIESRDKRL